MSIKELRRKVEYRRWCCEHPDIDLYQDRTGCGTPVGIFVVLVCLIGIMGLVGCKTHEVIVGKPVEVPHYIHDTLKVTQTEKETIYVTDSMFIKGDTVFKFRDRWREYVVHDTVLRAVSDTIGIPVEVTKTEIKEVEKELHWWQKGLMWCGGIALLLGAAWLVFTLKFKK